jgi:nucleotide-binding universal stress UspA family protein
MARKILVALGSEDRLGQMIPYIEKIAQPGMKVVLLVRFSPPAASHASRRNSFELSCLENSRLSEEELVKPSFTGEDTTATQSTEKQNLAVERKVFLALEALLKRGIEITSDIYTGSLRRAVRSYTRKGDVDLIVMRARRKLMIMDFLHLFKRSAFLPIVVVHPSPASLELPA